ncbi:MAG TPA: fatty acid desaturase CarF family protein [Tepidisphaeraceae bacterium]|nr:fatty acid desaturase CarF family protein [Tepidisphaeraceae bacterium]
MSLSNILLTSAKVVLEFTGAVFAADFTAGFIHWVEDAYGHEDTPIIGKWLIQANIQHHREPRAFVKKNWWQSNWDLTLVSALMLFTAWMLGVLHWPFVVFAILAANANEIHKWAHRTPRENGKIITFLHRARLMQDTRHHAKHHTNPKNSDYCTITNYLNPILDGIHFWEGLEFILLHTVGLRRRIDPTVPQPTSPKPLNIIGAPAPCQKCNRPCGRQKICENLPANAHA